jgi:hypothetical protein
MKLFLMFIPLILVYSQGVFSTYDNIINVQKLIIPNYYLNLKNLFNQMIDSCVNNENKNDCRGNIITFLNKASNNTIDFSTSIEEIYRDILTIIPKYPNLEMIKKNILQYLYNRFTNIVRVVCYPLNTRKLKENANCSTFLGNTLCRLFHFFWGDDAWDCD